MNPTRGERCRADEESDGTWYVDYKRPPTPRQVAELVAEVRCWLAEERIERTIVWIEEQPLPLIGLTGADVGESVPRPPGRESRGRRS